MHCFIGLHVQEPLASSVLTLTHHWQKLGYPPADFHKHTYPHITIIPPFDVPETAKLIADLAALTASFPTFDTGYARINVFNRRIVHIAVESNGIVDLRAKLYEVGKGIFHYQNNHPVFHAHSTIAYMHEPLTQGAFKYLQTKLETVLELPAHQSVEHISLYGRENPSEDYQTLAELKLS